VYRFAPAASRHVATTQHDHVDARIVARERARNTRSETDSKNHCEMGISSMFEYSFTTQMGALDSDCNDAAEPSRDIESASFRREKFLCANRRRSEFGACRALARKRKARESVITDSLKRPFGTL
jgi:hypothetical protein